MTVAPPRLGRIYDDEDGVHDLVDHAYRWGRFEIPSRNTNGPTIDECIHWLTGYEAVAREDIWKTELRPWLLKHIGPTWDRVLHKALRPAHVGHRGRYYYIRDIIGVVHKAKRDARRSKDRLRRRKELADKEREGWLLASVQLTAVKKLLKEMTLEV